MNRASETAIQAVWDCNEEASGYEVRVLFNSSYVVFSKYFGSKDAISRKLTGLKADETYQVQVRSVCKTADVGSYYSSWSKKIDVTL